MNEAPRVRVCAYDAQGLVENEIRDPDALIEFATNPATIWVDVAGVAGVNLLARLGEIFGLHSHLVQDLTVEHDTREPEGPDLVAGLAAPPDGRHGHVHRLLVPPPRLAVIGRCLRARSGLPRARSDRDRLQLTDSP